MQKDNSTLALKVSLRRLMLEHVEAPVVMETHGGLGKVWEKCYQDISAGVVFEKDPEKSAKLGMQRPTWAVYEAECEEAIRAGAGSHLAVNVLDCDPYGEPWPVIEAFFQSERPRPDRLAVVVNDGLRQKVRLGGAWSVNSLKAVVWRRGNDLFSTYLDVCKELITEKAAGAGYRLDRFTGYYCGHLGSMTHYLAMFQRSAG